MGVRVLLDKMLAPALAAAGIASAPAILRLGGDSQASGCVAVVDLPVDGTSGRFHVKRYRYASWAESKGLLGRGSLWGSAPEVKEFKNLAFLREKGIPAARPVAAASVTEKGRLVAHALVTEHVPGSVDLARRLATPGDPVRDDPRVRRRTLVVLGRHVHRMHLEGFVHRDLFARNVLVTLDDDEPGVWLCDCRRGGPPSMRAKPLDDLATIDSDLVGKVPARDRVAALRAYAGSTGSLSAFAKDVEKRREVVARRVRERAERRA